MGKLKRRNFMGRMGAGAAGAFGAQLSGFGPRDFACKRPLRLSETVAGANCRDTRVNIKPVANYMIHGGVWTGPCRWNPNPPPEEERANFKRYFREWLETVRDNISKDASILEPVYIEYSEAEGYGDRQLSVLNRDEEEVDLYLARGNVYPQYPAALIGERFRKPVAMIGSYVNWDMSARLNSKGLEGYSVENFNELNGLIAVLRARKAFQNTNILIVSDNPYNNRPAPSASVNFKDLRERFGFRAFMVGYKEFSEVRDSVMNDKTSMDEVSGLTDELVSSAEAVRMERDQIVPSVVFYATVKRLMAQYGCNAFTVECFEFCSNRKSFEWKAVPCMTHSLLKDSGCPSACEGDMNAFLAMNLLMGVSKRSAFMGNLYKKDEDTMFIHHNVPGMKMLGFEKPDLPYSLQNFITEGWGVKVQMDLAALGERTVTIARSDPVASKILITKGEITDCDGYDKVGCSLRAAVRVSDSDALIRKARNYGFHHAMVYGNHTQDMLDLVEMLGLDFETHNI